MHFNRLTVISEIKRNNRKYWKCKCDCGSDKEVIATTYQLKSGKLKSCGCYHSEELANRNKSNAKNNDYIIEEDIVRMYDQNGNSCIVDIQDFQYVKQWYWRKTKPRRRSQTEGYWVTNAKQEDKDRGYPTSLRLHQIIAELKFGKYDKKKYMPDHINRQHDDNTQKNIKLKPNIENSHNRNISFTNTSGKTGVSYNRYNQNWDSYITVNYKTIVLGSYQNYEDAVSARLKAEVEYGFTCDNIIPEYDYKGGHNDTTQQRQPKLK